MLTVGERSNSPDEFYRRMLEDFGNNLRVAMPGIITAFNSTEQTVTVQPALRENIVDGKGKNTWTKLPLLLDVPICIPRGGGFALTLPVKKGDECLIIFNDMCIDAWFTHGDIQNQIERRRHDLSDAVCIPGIWSQKKRILNYSTTSAQLRTEDGSQKIDITSNKITISGNVNLNGTVKVNGVIV